MSMTEEEQAELFDRAAKLAYRATPKKISDGDDDELRYRSDLSPDLSVELIDLGSFHQLWIQDRAGPAAMLIRVNGRAGHGRVQRSGPAKDALKIMRTMMVLDDMVAE